MLLLKGSGPCVPQAAPGSRASHPSTPPMRNPAAPGRGSRLQGRTAGTSRSSGPGEAAASARTPPSASRPLQHPREKAKSTKSQEKEHHTGYQWHSHTKCNSHKSGLGGVCYSEGYVQTSWSHWIDLVLLLESEAGAWRGVCVMLELCVCLTSRGGSEGQRGAGGVCSVLGVCPPTADRPQQSAGRPQSGAGRRNTPILLLMMRLECVFVFLFFSNI